MLRILDVGAMYGYPCANIFDPWDKVVFELEPYKPIKADILDRTDLIILGGGQDVSPELYGHKNVASHCGEGISERDRWERDLYLINSERATPVPMLGICRGAQFLCVLDGGWLVQDVNNHAGPDHEVFLLDDADYRTIRTNSYHHQMMVPRVTAAILGFANEITRATYDVEMVGINNPNNVNIMEVNPEIILFNHFCLGFQCHPEYLHPDEFLPTFTRKYVRKYFGIGERT